ncbi:MAG: hypothetical protein AAB334_01015 [Patescibacteria group bacterium]
MITEITIIDGEIISVHHVGVLILKNFVVDDNINNPNKNINGHGYIKTILDESSIKKFGNSAVIFKNKLVITKQKNG